MEYWAPLTILNCPPHKWVAKNATEKSQSRVFWRYIQKFKGDTLVKWSLNQSPTPILCAQTFGYCCSATLLIRGIAAKGRLKGSGANQRNEPERGFETVRKLNQNQKRRYYTREKRGKTKKLRIHLSSLRTVNVFIQSTTKNTSETCQ